ncbi:hypothetical protein MJO29_002963 [Puccinia striiformis f. sp. tritici]|nr:hypothetical protein MJO29_002963 [Puccinia striiformis f. sp. tritici]KAI9629432.1 hypothetical protein KEM48_012900 [Puccinia striiformis f. sp. tritici PST-130]
MMLNAAWIVVAALFIGKSAELSIPLLGNGNSAAGSYDKYSPVGKQNPTTWPGKLGTGSNSGNGIIKDATSRPGSDGSEDSPYKKSPYGSYQSSAQHANVDIPDVEGKPELDPEPSNDDDDEDSSTPSKDGTVASAEGKQHGGTSDEGRPWVHHGSSLGPYEGKKSPYADGKKSPNCTKDQSPYKGGPNDGTSAWKGTDVSATSRPGEKLQQPDHKPPSGASGSEDDDEDEDDEDDEDDQGDEGTDGSDDQSAENSHVGFPPVPKPHPSVSAETQSPTSEGPHYQGNGQHEDPESGYYHSVSSASKKSQPKPLPGTGY